MAGGPSLIFLLSDGIRGHLFQSRGVAGWLSRFTGADMVEVEIPKLSGWKRVRLLKWKARFLPSADREGALRWLKEAGASSLAERAAKEIASRNCDGRNVLFLSAGSSAAPFTTALSKTFGGRSCTLMTPSVLGTDPFDFAIVPEHDHPPDKENVFPTLGAPNAIFPDELERKGWELSQLYPPRECCSFEKRWSLLVGGDDGNYRVSAEWAERTLSPIFDAAERLGADLYVTTSRRTPKETEDALALLAKGKNSTRMLLFASSDPFNPVPGMLGLCSVIFVTEDSVSMVSEAVTAGRTVYLVRTGRQSGIRTMLQNMTAFLVRKRIAPRMFLWGIPRFDALFDDMIKKGFLVELRYDHLNHYPGRSPHLADGPLLNEARRAAEWIVERWTDA